MLLHPIETMEGEVLPSGAMIFTPMELTVVALAQVEPALRAVCDGVPARARGPGGHILTGPIAITGAEPGDMLEVRIRKVDLAIPYAYNAFRYGAGFLTDDFSYARMKIVPLDAKRMVGLFAPGVEVPLAPFFGSMGVAPPAAFGRYDSAPPTINDGNMDDNALVAGTTLFLPVYAPDALFQVGDGHAAQGNGEVDITALEISLTGTFRAAQEGGDPLSARRDAHGQYRDGLRRRS
ncbi:acetamidase/formamidase family protein [Sphingomonas sp. PP-CE-3G-477]|uniref:acetamidase/formamidase family protein n=1 Tax=Sphingomonas sp. PP-CE-3G-477 TaxID=2135660 RepID=UPI000D3F3450|nr:acetamidase/formamidase family protein [Sphingomonas sp. PP-CE-3G-477]PTQ60758.1 acetamidase/formamidase family protein [Sphingomonas sp. PP-CE-3G-477]